MNVGCAKSNVQSERDNNFQSIFTHSWCIKSDREKKWEETELKKNLANQKPQHTHVSTAEDWNWKQIVENRKID